MVQHHFYIRDLHVFPSLSEHRQQDLWVLTNRLDRFQSLAEWIMNDP
jgi:hypothetical protein